jgi:hypothetical protein
MKTVQHAISAAIAGVGLTALLLSAGVVQPLKIDFSDESVGTEPKSFVSVVGCGESRRTVATKCWS